MLRKILNSLAILSRLGLSSVSIGISTKEDTILTYPSLLLLWLGKGRYVHSEHLHSGVWSLHLVSSCRRSSEIQHTGLKNVLSCNGKELNDRVFNPLLEERSNLFHAAWGGKRGYNFLSCLNSCLSGVWVSLFWLEDPSFLSSSIASTTYLPLGKCLALGINKKIAQGQPSFWPTSFWIKKIRSCISRQTFSVRLITKNILFL